MDPQTVINMRRRTVRLEREGDYWTKAEKEALRRLFNEGVGITEMASILQRTEPAIIQQIENMDLYERKKNPIRRKSHTKSPGYLCNKCVYCQTCFATRKHCTQIKEEA